jgi:hypothetical protein
LTSIAALSWSAAARAARGEKSAWTRGPGNIFNTGSTFASNCRLVRCCASSSGRTAGRSWAAPAARCCLRQLAVQAEVRRRFAPHQLRHAHAVDMAREGLAFNVIQRQLGHTDLGVTSIYLLGIDNSEIIATVHARPAPTLPASAGLRYLHDI